MEAQENPLNPFNKRIRQAACSTLFLLFFTTSLLLVSLYHSFPLSIFRFEYLGTCLNITRTTRAAYALLLIASSEYSCTSMCKTFHLPIVWRGYRHPPTHTSPCVSFNQKQTSTVGELQLCSQLTKPDKIG